MRTSLKLGLGVGLVMAVGYTATLGVYAVSSTRPAVPSQPASAEEADRVIRALGLEQEYPFEHHFLATPHGRMHYVDEGTGAPVLCVHGNPTWSFLYRNFVKGLSGEARVVAPNLIGFGLSQKLPDPDAYSMPPPSEYPARSNPPRMNCTCSRSCRLTVFKPAITPPLESDYVRRRS